jgi:hypothetical protein
MPPLPVMPFMLSPPTGLITVEPGPFAPSPSLLELQPEIALNASRHRTPSHHFPCKPIGHLTPSAHEIPDRPPTPSLFAPTQTLRTDRALTRKPLRDHTCSRDASCGAVAAWNRSRERQLAALRCSDVSGHAQ